jgi:hypothetical protein
MGELGYGFLQEPLAPARGAGAPLGLTHLRAHGPIAAASARWQGGDLVELELGGRLLAPSLGGSYRDEHVSVLRFGGGVTAGLRLVEAGGARVLGVLGYELVRTTASGAAEVDQLHHQIALGLRVSAVPPVASVSAVAPPPPRARLRGVARAEAEGGGPGEPLVGVLVTVVNGPSARTGADGSFAFAGLAPGLVEVKLAREDLLPAAEVVSLPAGGEVTLPLVLRRLAAPAVVRGLVRAGRGTPVQARVRLVERDEETQSDETGHFQFVIPAGRYTLTIDAAGYVSQRKGVEARAGEHNVYNVDLQEQR